LCGFAAPTASAKHSGNLSALFTVHSISLKTEYQGLLQLDDST
jgi:hypothetical protein